MCTFPDFRSDFFDFSEEKEGNRASEKFRLLIVTMTQFSEYSAEGIIDVFALILNGITPYFYELFACHAMLTWFLMALVGVLVERNM